MKTKTQTHTPGPWVLGTNGLLEVWPMDQREEKICRFFKAENREQQLANARLIAGAPDLLKAAKKVIDAFDRDFSDRICTQAEDPILWLRKAIAKAE